MILSASSSNFVSWNVPRPLMNDRNQSSLLSFIFRLSVLELTFLLPVKTIFLIFTFGPSDMWNVRWMTFGPPAIG